MKNPYIIGVDEVGRGAIAGSIIVAAVILPVIIEGVDDSKLLSAKEREKIRDLIINSAIAYSISEVKPNIINRLNIVEATRRGMLCAIRKILKEIKSNNAIVFIDGNMPPLPIGISQRYFVKGDRLIYSIAAASILAKVHRDRIMVERLFPLFPQYAWNKNKGYPTREHILATKRYGITPYHRKAAYKYLL
jgi:ribonuclease HII